MQSTNKLKSVDAGKPTAFVLVCNSLILGVLIVLNFITFFLACLMCFGGYGVSGFPEHPLMLLGVYPFVASLTLTLGHARIFCEPALSRFSTTFWPIATVHYLVLITVYLWWLRSGDLTPSVIATWSGSDFAKFLSIAAICCLPAILSLPPLVFTIRQAMKLRRLPRA